MHDYIQHLRLAVKRFLLVLILYSVCRIFFYILNRQYFVESSLYEIILSFISGIRFDIAAVIFTNFFILFLLLPGSYKNLPYVQKTGTGLFYAINSFALLLNIIDARFFDFINKRSTSAIFTLMTSNSDVWSVLPGIISDYWYVALFWMVIIFIFIKTSPALKDISGQKLTVSNLFLQIVVFSFITGLMLLGARGTKLKPLSITDAASAAGPKHIPLVLNTTFSILKSVENENLQEHNWIAADSIESVYNPFHESRAIEHFKNFNVVIFILESFSKEYCGSLGGIQGYTPNLDSLLEKSLVFTIAYANGTQSYEALPAIIAGIPSLMDRPYSGSNYADNRIESLPYLLRRMGYFTSFFHGGNNGTMGFNNFAKIAGIEKYYGRNEYGNDADFDGHWGIWDEPYLKYFADKISEFPEPFFTAIFTLSSHHPYSVPEKFKNRFKDGKLPILKSIAYTDYSIGEFFRLAALKPWFHNTLFVFTADHAAQAIDKTYNSNTGMFSIPLAFYQPSDTLLRGVDSTISQQIDILPTVLDYLQYPEDYFAFGSSLIDKQSRHCGISYSNGIYQLVQDHMVMQFDGEKVISFNDIKGNQPNMEDKVMQMKYSQLEKEIRAIIQTYNYCLIHNYTYLEAKKDSPAKFFSKSDNIN